MANQRVEIASLTAEEARVIRPRPAFRLAMKRLIDIGLSLMALAILWPILLSVAIAIKLTSPGPIFYRGVRSGLNGKQFRILKFRTMVVNAELLGGHTTATKDKRVTKIGKLLRKTKLDEFPQFWNVLVGTMSLVGPRPEVQTYTDRYKGEEKLILSMRPGITDFASIEFADLDDRVGTSNPDEVFQRDILPKKNLLRLKYVKEWSLTSDAKILTKTFFRVVRRAFK